MEELEGISFIPSEGIKNEWEVSYLLSTDWVVTKISEAVLLGEDVEFLKTKYATQLQKRKEARDAINA